MNTYFLEHLAVTFNNDLLFGIRTNQKQNDLINIIILEAKYVHACVNLRDFDIIKSITEI